MKHLKSELKESRNFKNLAKVYVPYPINFASKHNLTHKQALLYAIIAQFSKLEYKAYTGSLQTLQVILNLSKSGLLTALKVIVERGFVKKGTTENGRVCYVATEFPSSEHEVYVAYPLKLAVKFNLSCTQALLYSIVAHYSKQTFKAFTGSISSLARYLNTSEESVRLNLNELITRGFIIKYKNESANVTYVDGLSHKPGKTEKELEFNALWASENGLTRVKAGRSARKKGLTKVGEITPRSKRFGSHFANERPYNEDYDIFEAFNKIVI